MEWIELILGIDEPPGHEGEQRDDDQHVPRSQAQRNNPPHTTQAARLPLAIFGPENYGYRLGIIGAPSRLCQALAPLAFGFLIVPLGGYVLVVTSALSIAALVALSFVRPTTRSDRPQAGGETAENP